MKAFLFDENIPRGPAFESGMPIFHAKDLGAGVSDSLIWNYAREQRLAIVTKTLIFRIGSCF